MGMLGSTLHPYEHGKSIKLWVELVWPVASWMTKTTTESESYTKNRGMPATEMGVEGDREGNGRGREVGDNSGG